MDIEKDNSAKSTADKHKREREELQERMEKRMELERDNAKDSLDDIQKHIDKYGITYTMMTQSEMIVGEELRHKVFGNLCDFTHDLRKLKRQVNDYIGAWRGELLNYSTPRWSNPIRNDVEALELEAKARLLDGLTNIWKQL